MPRGRTKLGALLVLAASLVVAGSAAGDWLVTTDGGRVETAGPWQTKGRLIVFTRSSDGQLASMRASEVDLAASAQLTAQMAAAAVAPPPPPPASKPPVLVLTDEDVAPFQDAETAAGPAAPGEAAGDDDARRQLAPEGLVVAQWDTLEQENGAEIVGTVRNDGDLVQTRVEINVRILGADGNPITVQRAVLANATLAPGRSTEFRLLVPEIYTIERAEFDITAVPFQETPAPAAATEESAVPEREGG